MCLDGKGVVSPWSPTPLQGQCAIYKCVGVKLLMCDTRTWCEVELEG